MSKVTISTIAQNRTALTYADMAKTYAEYTVSYADTGNVDAVNYYTWLSTPLTWAESKMYWRDYGTSRWLLEVEEDNVGVTDTFWRTAHYTFRENIRLTDELKKKSIVKRRSEAISISETYWDNIKFKLRFSENIVVANEFAQRYVSKNANDTVLLLEEVDNTLATMYKESLAIDDVYNRHIVTSRNFDESITITQKQWQQSNVRKRDEFSIDDSYNNHVGKNEFAVVTFSDNMKRNVIFKPYYAESVAIFDNVTKHINHITYDTLALYDSYLSPLNGVLSNLNIKETSMTLAEFKSAIDTPPNFNEFIEFKVGEYEYQEALVRIRMKTKANLAQPSASDVVMHVDIPDTDDRGTVSIEDTTQATEVMFNKFYYTLPEVSVTLRGASTADGNIIPNIVSISTNKFEVELLSGGKRVKGSISWVAKGY